MSHTTQRRQQMSTKEPVNQNDGRISMKRRDFLRIGGLAALGSVLAACGAAAPAAPEGGAATAPAGAAAPTAAPPAANTGAKQTVRYLSWWFEEGNRGKTWLAFVKEFNDSHPEIEVKTENIPFDAYTTKTIVGAQSGKLDGDI